MDQKRRKFLKVLLVGGGVLLVGKLFSSRVLSLFSSDSKIEKDFESFKVSEDKNGLIISDRNGHEIFIIDRGE